MQPLPQLSIIINYFNPGNNPRVDAMVRFNLECLAACTQTTYEIILVDGSGTPHSGLEKLCCERGWVFLTCPSTRFAQSYNQGMLAARGQYRVWLASDLFVCQGWDSCLIAEIQRTGAWMAAPYLTNSDYMVQTRWWPVKMWTFYPSAMTFNLNLLTSECFEKVGVMDDRFTGCFNDTDYLIRIRQAGGEAVIVDAGQILHVGRGTSSAASTVNGNQDQERFLEKYPWLRRGAGTVDWCHPIFVRSGIYRSMARIARSLRPRRATELMSRAVAKFEPLFHSV